MDLFFLTVGEMDSCMIIRIFGFWKNVIIEYFKIHNHHNRTFHMVQCCITVLVCTKPGRFICKRWTVTPCPRTTGPLYPYRPHYNNSELREQRKVRPGSSGTNPAKTHAHVHTHSNGYTHIQTYRNENVCIELTPTCRHTHAHIQDIGVQFQSSPGLTSALFFTWLHAEQDPWCPVHRLIPSSSTIGLVRPVEAREAWVSFIKVQQQYIIAHGWRSMAPAHFITLCWARVESTGFVLVIRRGAWWSHVQLVHICPECDS